MPKKKITKAKLIKAYKAVNGEKWYRTNLEIIKNFIRLHPKNKDVNVVAAKVALIDLTNSTQFFHQQKNGVTLKQFAQNIVDCNFDKRIKKRDPQLVTDICKGYKRTLNINHFSLASKYCHYHNRFLESIPEENRYEYPIYDSNVSKNIPKYINKITIEQLGDIRVTTHRVQTCKDEGDYKLFNAIIEQILKNNHITKKMMPNRKVALDCLLYGSQKQKRTIRTRRINSSLCTRIKLNIFHHHRVVTSHNI